MYILPPNWIAQPKVMGPAGVPILQFAQL